VKLLVVEDEAKLSRMLQRGLTEEGHQVDVCATGEDAFERLAQVPYDAVVLDWSLPDADGPTLLRRWRERGDAVPVLMLTARGTTGEKVAGLRAGADDYLVKPFDFDELLARLEALVRRSGGRQSAPVVGDVTLDPRKRCLRRGAEEAGLTSREYALALEFFTHPGEVLSRTRLMSSVWGLDFDGQPNVVEVYVGYLRTKLQGLGAATTVQTVRGVGYRLVGAP